MQQPKNPETTSLYPNNIGRCIKQQGYTQEEVADAIGIARRTLSNYISGKRATPRYCLEKIAQTIGCEIEALTLQPEHQSSPSSQDTPEVRQETASDQNTEGDDMDRRRTLQFLGAAGTLLVGAPAITHLEEIEKVIRQRVARLQTWLVDSLEDATLQRWQLYYTSRNSLTEGGLYQQIGRLEQLADGGGEDESRIYSVLIQNYQLAGSLARDNFHYIRAKKYFHDAQRLANEIQSPDLTATAVARLAVVLMRQAGGDVTDSGYGKLVADALELYHSAAKIATHAEAHVRAYVLAGLAEAQARGGHRDACYRTLDEAEQLLHRSLVVSPDEDIAHVRLTLQSLEDTRGECFVLLGEPLKGLSYLQAAQKSLNPTISRNLCRLLMQQSEAYLAAGYPDQSVHHALQGLHVARTLESTSNINWAHEIHIKLLRSRWRDETVIGELEAALAG